MAKNSSFRNIDEELTWEMFKLSEGNPYIVQDLVRERNEIREKTSTKEELVK